MIRRPGPGYWALRFCTLGHKSTYRPENEFKERRGRPLLYDTPRTIEVLLEMLTASPSRIAEMTEVLSAHQLVTAPGEGEWSGRHVLAHLLACSDVWGKYIQLILGEERPTFKAVNPTTWTKQTDYLSLPFQALFRAFSLQRRDLLAVLAPLPPENWNRSAVVTGAGRPRERTVYTYAQWLANHERSHFKQFHKIAAALRG